jgi:S-formylglutathione hydrolase FrmB
MDRRPACTGPRRRRSPLRAVLPLCATCLLAVGVAVLPAGTASAAVRSDDGGLPDVGALIDEALSEVGSWFGDGAQGTPAASPSTAATPSRAATKRSGSTAAGSTVGGSTVGGSTVKAAAAADVTADDGARVVAQTQVDTRTLDLTIASPALHGNGKVRLLLPAGWSADATRTWPSLYLLHGANEPADYTSWTTFTDARSFLAPKDVIAVMPSDGGAGFYSDSWNYGRWDGPDWEAFHTAEIPQLLSRGYHASDVRAAAGLSIGGLGAIDYAARHPGLFRAVASYSGMLDTLLPGVPVYVDTIKLREAQDPLALWGSDTSQRSIWQQHNPADLVPWLKGVAVYVSSGDGLGGELDRGASMDFIEPVAYASTQSFVARMRAAGLPVTVHFHGGTHTWLYWERELHDSWPFLASALGVAT